MSEPEANSGGWSRARFLMLATVLFAIQVGLVLSFAERPRLAPAPPVLHTVFHRLGRDLDEATLSKHIFASDPTIFPSSASFGFADQAWLRLAPVEYNQTNNDSEAPSFLEYAANSLRTDLLPGSASGRIFFDAPDEMALPQEPTPAYTAGNARRSASFVRIDGPLALRRMDTTAPAVEWPAATVLSNTVVRFGVNRSGEVVSAGLWSTSGSADADANAVNTINAMRFAPTLGTPDDFTWSRATFFWRTVPLPATNTPATPQIP